MAVRARLQIAHLDNWLMDAEHGQMVHLIENLEDAIRSGKDEPTIRNEFDRLIAWTAKHFAHENDHMLQTKFKAAQAHIEHHRRLIETLKGFVSGSADGADEKVRAPDAIQFLENWLVHHIETDDAELAEFLARKTTRWGADNKSDRGN
jgi:hemerythrin